MKNTKKKAMAAKTTGFIKRIVMDSRGAGMIDLTVNIMISVVLGALVLSGLYLLFGSTVLPMLSEKIVAMFSYTPVGP